MLLGWVGSGEGVSLYWCVCRLLRQSKKLIDIVGEPGKATGKPGSFS